MTRPIRFLSGSNSPPPSLDPKGRLDAWGRSILDIKPVLISMRVLLAVFCTVSFSIIAVVLWGFWRENRHRRNITRLKKKFIKALPKQKYDAAVEGRFTETACPICLAEYAQGDDIRVLPQCCHIFHVACIDKWLASQSSCPSCRLTLVSPCQCKTIGVLPEDSGELMQIPSQIERSMRPDAAELSACPP